MKIGYRRWSATMGMSGHETFQRGGWLEKRVALLEELERRGHTIHYLSTPTRASRGLWDVETTVENVDALFLEVTNENLFQNYDRIKESVEMLNKFNGRGKIFFLYDDPQIVLKVANKTITEALPPLHLNLDELILLSNNMPGHEEFLRNHIFYSTNIKMGFLNVKNIVVESFPIAGLMKYPQFPSAYTKGRAVYIGSTSGNRDRILNSFPFPLDTFLPGNQPTQSERNFFYSQYLWNLGLSDIQHKKLGWYTGRIFHALSAGVPSFLESNNPLLPHFDPIPKDIGEKVQPRPDAFYKSMQTIPVFKEQVNQVLLKYGI